MSLVEFPQSPHPNAYAVLGLCCSHAAYCPFYMFEGLDARGGAGVRWVGRGRGRERKEEKTKGGERL